MTAPSDFTRTVVGLITERRHAEPAIRDLKSAGFTEDQIGVAMQNHEEQQSLIDDTGSQAAEGAAQGAVSGGIVGGLIGLLGSLLIPGVGPIVVGGVLASVLTGAGVGAATGGLIGALMGLGVPEEDAQHFDRGLRAGGVLITVNAGARVPEAIAILRSHEADLGPSGLARYGIGSGAAGDRGVQELVGQQRLGLLEDAATLRQGLGNRYQGQERRRRRDRGYAGPERRVAL